MFICRSCNKELPESSYRVRKDRSNYRIKSCRSCERKENEELRQIHKLAPAKGEFCDCCHKKVGSKNLQLDHCHDKKVFRGWICNKCNFGLGNFGDTERGIMKALEYLRRANDSI